MTLKQLDTKLKKEVIYSQTSLNNSVNNFIGSNTRKDRDGVIKNKEKLEVLNQVLKMIEV
jgi:hypothetical protein